MTARALRALMAFAGAASCFCAFALSAGAASPDRAGYIVVLKDSVQHPAAVARSELAGRDATLGFVYRHALKGYSARLPKAAVAALRNDPRVAYIEPDAIGGVAAQTTPTAISRNFATKNPSLDIDGIDDLRIAVDVAVIDSGVDHNHPDLNVVARTDCSNGPEDELFPGKDITPVECIDESGTDGNKHGTHVAGTVGAIDNDQGVVGVAPGARIWAVKVLDSTGWGTVSEYIAGIDWVTANTSQIEVANSSLTYYQAPPSQAFSEAMQASLEAGVVHVAAAGNNEGSVKSIPGNDPDVITVSALADYDGLPNGSAPPTCWDFGPDDHLASFSNYGPLIDVAAPGTCVLSTLPGNQYGLNSGTSMAAPQVAGAAAILASGANPESKADVEAIRQQIIAAGNYFWTDTSPDGVQEPLLNLRNDVVFGGRGPVAAYSFNEAQGTLLHDSAGRHDGSIKNGTAWTSSGKYGSALDFDGVNDFVSIADASDLDLTGPFTLEAWVQPDVGTFDPVIAKADKPGQAGAAGYALDAAGPNAQRPDAYVGDGSTLRSVVGAAPLPVSPPTWSHLAVTSDGSTLTFYVNGEWQAEAQAISAKASAANLELGRVGGILNWYFDGRIDEVRLYDQALDSQQIDQDMGGSFSTPEARILTPEGIYLAGAESSEEAEQPHFQAVTYPLALSGHQISPNALQFTIAGSSISCSSASFAAELTAPDQEIPLLPQFSSCTAGGYATTIDPNSCTLKGALANSGPPYTGTASISCEAGDQIEFDIRNAEETQVCLAKVPPQSLGGSIAFENQGPGRSRRVRATFSTTGMKWTRTGLCNFDGKGKEGTNGQLSGSLSLGAS